MVVLEGDALLAWLERTSTGWRDLVTAGAESKNVTNRGFWLALPWHGQGLMSEAVATVNDYWFDVLGCLVLRVSKAIDNPASRRISEKTGMRVIATKESDYVCGRLPSEVWEQTAEEWRAKRTTLAD